MADAEHARGLGAGRQNPLRACRGQRQRLLAKHLLAGGKSRDRHLLVQRMWGYNRDGVDIGPFEQFPIFFRQVELVGGCEGRCHRAIDIATGNDLETRAFGEARDNLFAPPAQTDNSDTDHLNSSSGT